jgi:hypothetical protein
MVGAAFLGQPDDGGAGLGTGDEGEPLGTTGSAVFCDELHADAASKTRTDSPASALDTRPPAARGECGLRLIKPEPKRATGGPDWADQALARVRVLVSVGASAG